VEKKFSKGGGRRERGGGGNGEMICRGDGRTVSDYDGLFVLVLFVLSDNYPSGRVFFFCGSITREEKRRREEKKEKKKKSALLLAFLPCRQGKRQGVQSEQWRTNTTSHRPPVPVPPSSSIATEIPRHPVFEKEKKEEEGGRKEGGRTDV